MSSAILRQSLEFVESEGIRRSKKKSNIRSDSKPSDPIKPKQNYRHISKITSKKSKGNAGKPNTAEEDLEEKIKYLQKLSQPVVDSRVLETFVERATKGRPLNDYIPVSKEEEKSILCPDTKAYKKFERELFYS